MGSLLTLLGVARDAMSAYSGGLSVVGQNISGASLPGYVRRSPVLEARGWPGGGGVDFAGARRAFDRFTHGKLVHETGKQRAASERLRALQSIEAIAAPPSGGIADGVSAFFSAAAALSANASDPTSRSVFLARAGELARRVSETAAQLAGASREMLEGAQSKASEINDIVSRIARFNVEISSAQARGDEAADLRDARDELVEKLSEKTGARAIEDERGRLTVFAGGTPIVQADEASALRVDLDSAGRMRIEVVRPGGTVLDVTSAVGGELGGLREARDVDLAAASGDLDRFAFDFAQAVNAVHASGFGLDGATGRPLFEPPTAVQGAAYSMAVSAAVGTDPSRVAAAGAASGLPGGSDAIVRLQGLASSPLAGGGRPSERVAQWLGEIGNAVQSAQREVSLREGTVHQAKILHESQAGVSLDEEMVDLGRYERAFEAATRALRTADELLKDLIEKV